MTREARRKHRKLTEYLTSVMTNANFTDRLRFTAACRLDDALAREQDRRDEMEAKPPAEPSGSTPHTGGTQPGRPTFGTIRRRT